MPPSYLCMRRFFQQFVWIVINSYFGRMNGCESIKWDNLVYQTQNKHLVLLASRTKYFGPLRFGSESYRSLYVHQHDSLCIITGSICQFRPRDKFGECSSLRVGCISHNFYVLLITKRGSVNYRIITEHRPNVG